MLIDPDDGTTRSLPHGPVDDLHATYTWTGDALLGYDTMSRISYFDGRPDAHPGMAALWDVATDQWITLPDAPRAGAQPGASVWTGTHLLLFGALSTPQRDTDDRLTDTMDTIIQLGPS